MAVIRRLRFIVLAGLIILLTTAGSCTSSLQPEASSITPSPTFSQSAESITSPSTSRSTSQPAPIYSYQVIHAYNHAKDAFTEGLVYEDNVLYEGTGLTGKSSLRQVDLTTGEIQRIYNLPAQYFGEGITIYQDKIIQLTWKSQIGFIYNKGDFNLLSQFTYTGEGWGLTFDGKQLIMSDGTDNLRFFNPDTLEPIGRITVHDQDIPIDQLNELEYIDGKVYANVWKTDRIAIINPQDGLVTGWLDLTGILHTPEGNGPVDVLNGIAYDAQTQHLLVTGKYWPYLYEIVPVANP